MGNAQESAAKPLLDVITPKVARGLLIRRVLAEKPLVQAIQYTLSGREIHMSTHVGIEQSGKSGGEAIGFSGSSSMGLGGGANGLASAGGLGFNTAGAEATGGDALSGSTASGALGGDVSDNTQIGSISINS
jgi:hypothetical protein